MSGFATFWHGPLPALIAACLTSFPTQGATLVVYTYDRGLAAPRGIEVRDAREICPDLQLMTRYRVGGRTSAPTFADRFRYEMLARTDQCWVDADMIALRPFTAFEPVIWGRQPEAKGKALINNAVLRLPSGHPVLTEMLALARRAEGADVAWGAIGPYLLTEVAEAHRVEESASPPSRFFAVAPDAFWQLLDPASNETVAKATAGSDMLHLWSELLRRVGYDFEAAPPNGSYLHDVFAEIGALPRFARVSAEAEIAALIARWNASAPEKGSS